MWSKRTEKAYLDVSVLRMRKARDVVEVVGAA